jgi:hypothetical protein
LAVVNGRRLTVQQMRSALPGNIRVESRRTSK